MKMYSSTVLRIPWGIQGFIADKIPSMLVGILSAISLSHYCRETVTSERNRSKVSDGDSSEGDSSDGDNGDGDSSEGDSSVHG